MWGFVWGYGWNVIPDPPRPATVLLPDGPSGNWFLRSAAFLAFAETAGGEHSNGDCCYELVYVSV